MKKIFLLFLFSIFFVSLIGAGDTKVYIDEVIVSTSATIIASKRVNRKYFLAINTSDTYIVKIASWTLTNTDKGIPLNMGYGHREDVFFVYNSTWYAVNLSTWTTVTVSIEERE